MGRKDLLLIRVSSLDKYYIFLSIILDVGLILRRFQREPVYYSEAEFRVRLWDPLLSRFFNEDDVTVFVPEFSLERINLAYPKLAIDAVVKLSNTGVLKGKGAFPLLLVEVSRAPLLPDLVHKDQLKLAGSMTAALMRLFGLYKSTEDKKRIKLRVFGLLIGGVDFEVAVTYPDYRINPDGTVEFLGVIYRSARHCWRFSLFREKGEQSSYVPDSDFCCSPRDGCQVRLPDVTNHSRLVPSAVSASEARFGRAAFQLETEEGLSVKETEEIAALARAELGQPASEESSALLRPSASQAQTQIQPQTSRPSSPLSRASPIAFPALPGTIEAGMELDFSGLEVDELAVGALTEVAKQVKWMSASILGDFDREPPGGTFGDYSFSPDQIKVLPKGEPQHTPHPSRSGSPRAHGAAAGGAMDTPAFPDDSSNINGHVVHKSVQHWKDVNGAPWVSVVKRNSKFESFLYSLFKMQGSPFFPTLLDVNVEPNGVLEITLERIIPQDQFAKTYPATWESIPRMRLVLARFFLDLMGALRTLHSLGFVHSDISPSNVGFNPQKGMWQLFDFDLALPIDESLRRPRNAGTPPFLSEKSEKTGIFGPFDDYIALLVTGFDGFPRRFFGWGMDIIEPVLPLTDVFSDRADPDLVDLDKCYAFAFRVFCEEFEQAHQGQLSTDPSYLAALPIIESLNQRSE